jgi:hypothetical protein
MGYGALNDAGSMPLDGVRGTADLGCISRDNGAMYVRSTAWRSMLVVWGRSMAPCSTPTYENGVEAEPGAKLAAWDRSGIGCSGDGCKARRTRSLNKGSSVLVGRGDTKRLAASDTYGK